jgi:hypothetical protein
MTVQYSTTVRAAMADAWETAQGTAVKVRIYTGTQPASCATAASGTLIIEFALASDWATNPGTGVKVLNGLPLSGAATGAGTNTAGHYRFYDTAGTNCHEQGSITATGGGGDMTIDNTSIASGQTVQVTGYTKTWPGA